MTAAPRTPTSYDVARAAGVSQSAVSRAFRPGGSIAPETRARIEAAARDLGYAPNAVAGALSTRRTGLVAVIISALTNLYYPEVLAELTQRLSARGARVLLFALDHESAVDEVLPQLWRYRVDGAVAAARLSPPQIAEFARRSVPLVLYNRADAGGAASSVACDSAGGMALLVDKLRAGGARRFALIGGPEDSVVGEARVAAARSAIAAARLPEPPMRRGNFSYQSGHDAAAALLKQGRFDAVVAANDSMALGAVDAARAAGLDVPGDLSIVGFDGVGPASWAAYQLTTVRQPVRGMTQAAVDLLLDRIADPARAPEQLLFPGQLVRGRSANLGE